MIMFIQTYRPFESKFDNRLEIFNELGSLCLVYIAMCFTNFVQDPELRYDIGPFYIAAHGMMLLVHITILFVSAGKTTKQACKNCTKKSKDKSKKEANRVKPSKNEHKTQGRSAES